jgi:hypothetical protein
MVECHPGDVLHSICVWHVLFCTMLKAPCGTCFSIAAEPCWALCCRCLLVPRPSSV